MGKSSGGNIPQVSAPTIDISQALASFQKGADVIEKQFPIALEQYFQYAGQGARDAIAANTQAILITLPYGDAASQSLTQMRQLMGLPPVSPTLGLSNRMQSLASQLQTAPFVGMNFIGDMSERLTYLQTQLDKAENIEDPVLRQQIKDQLTPQFQQVVNGIEGDRVNWSNFQKYLSSDFSKKPPTAKDYDVVAFSDNRAIRADGSSYAITQTEFEDLKQQAGSNVYSQLGKEVNPDVPVYVSGSKDTSAGGPNEGFYGGFGGAATQGSMLDNAYATLKEYGVWDGLKEKTDTTNAGTYVPFDQLTDEQKQQLGFKDVPQSDLAGITGLNDFIKRWDSLTDPEKLQVQASVNFFSQASPQIADIGDRFGTNYLANKATGPNPQDIFNQLQQLPTYQFQTQQGMQALSRSQAAKGTLGSGNSLLEAQQFGQGMAQNAWQQQLGNLGSIAGLTLPFASANSQLTNAGGLVQMAANTEAGSQRQSSLQGIAQARQGAYNLSGQGIIQSSIAQAQLQMQAQIANQNAAIAKAQMSASSGSGMMGAIGGILGAIL